MRSDEVTRRKKDTEMFAEVRNQQTKAHFRYKNPPVQAPPSGQWRDCRCNALLKGRPLSFCVLSLRKSAPLIVKNQNSRPGKDNLTSTGLLIHSQSLGQWRKLRCNTLKTSEECFRLHFWELPMRHPSFYTACSWFYKLSEKIRLSKSQTWHLYFSPLWHL